MSRFRHLVAIVTFVAVALVLQACTSAQVSKNVATGQLYCAKATATGPLVVALATATGGPVNVIGQTDAYVRSACAVIGAIAVSPPANPGDAPTVTIPSVTVPLRS